MVASKLKTISYRNQRKLNKAQSVVVAENKGLTVKQVTELRNKLQEAVL